MEDYRIKINEICEKLYSYFKFPCYYEPDTLRDGVIFKLETNKRVYFQTVATNRIVALSVPSIVALVVSEFEEQMGNETFIIRLLPFNRKLRTDNELIFDDVSGIVTGDYPKIEIQKASDPIKVIMIVPEGYYLVEDHTNNSNKKGEL